MAASGQSNWRYPAQGIIPVPYHHTMLADRHRCRAFEEAIARVVRPGDVVFEAGAGTGLLSYFAARRARKVYAVEADPSVAALGRALIQRNGLEGRVEYRHGLAQEQLPPEPVDVVIGEMLHVALAVEQQVPVLNAVRQGLDAAHPGHPYRVVPAAAVTYCQLVEANFDFYGYEAPFTRLGSSYVADPSIRPLSGLETYHLADFGQIVAPRIAGSCIVTTTAAGIVNAVRLCTQAIMVEPAGEQRQPDGAAGEPEEVLDWYLNFLVIPLPQAFPAREGDTFTVSIDYEAGCVLEQIQLDVSPARS